MVSVAEHDTLPATNRSMFRSHSLHKRSDPCFKFYANDAPCDITQRAE